ncbi:MAG: adenosylmethionine--8-amino-7-oxononanoate transaminase [Kiritimatiellae bacterium]|nr:adenosylmethionine--8-amino-7-oxononanoate transaminase [Kiritimatiellia bacterium]
MKDNAILEYDRTFVWHPYASLTNPPPVRLAKSANGVEITLADGSRLIDAVASWWSVAHGHNHPKIVEAMRKQGERLSHVMFGGFTHEGAVTLAEKLAAIAPDGLNKVFLADSGSIAVEVAVKMCLQYQNAKGRKQRTKMLALKGGYHGDTACAMALSDPDGMHTLFAGMMPKHFFAEKFSAKFDIEELVMFAETLEKHRDEIAGVICEPVFQAANAMWFYSPVYLTYMKSMCAAADIPLVFDEIAAGFHRTGPLWAHRAAKVTPDIMCVGKALTGGHCTLAATIASEDVARTISEGTPSAFMHGPTFMANPIACAAANASLELFAEGDYEAKANGIEKILAERLPPLKALANVKDVRVKGAVGIVEVERMPRVDDIERVIRDNGVWLRPFCNYIYTMPPLVADARAVEKISSAIADLASAPPGDEIADGDFHE